MIPSCVGFFKPWLDPTTNQRDPHRVPAKWRVWYKSTDNATIPFFYNSLCDTCLAKDLERFAGTDDEVSFIRQVESVELVDANPLAHVQD